MTAAQEDRAAVVGYIGLGAMGGALARNLLRHRPITVHDRSAEAVERLVAAGASSSGALALAESSDVVFLCLPTSDHVAAVLTGPDGILDALRPGTLVIDQTSGDPAVTRQLAATLRDRGVGLVDAPVSGGVPRALDGTIAMMVGGASEDLARAMEVLGSMTPLLFHAGEVGTGHAMKLVNNLMSGVQRLLTFECLALAATSGIEPDRAHEILMAGGARNSYLEKVAGPSLLGGEPSPDFSIGLAHKDVRLACEMAAAQGATAFFGAQARELLQTCMAIVGPEAEVDQAALVVERIASTRIVVSTGIFKHEPVLTLTDERQ